MIDFLQRDHGQYSRVGIFLGMAFFACSIMVFPGRQAFFIEPYGQASTIDQGLVILFPVAEAILGFGFFGFHTLKIPSLSSPLLFLCNKAFYSYSHKDEEFRNQLEKHLKLLEREGLIQQWHDRDIGAGTDWEGEISKNLELADLILLLVSSDFLASDYSYDKEMNRAMERHNANEACVIPIILRDVDCKSAPFSRLQALPKDAKPITNWANTDVAWTDVAKGIRKVIDRLRADKEQKILRLEAIKPEKFNKNMITLEDYRDGAEILIDRIEYRDSFDPEVIIAVNQGGMVITAVMNKYWRKPVGIAYTASEKNERVVKVLSLPSEFAGSFDTSELVIKFKPPKPRKILVVDPKLKSGNSAARIRQLLYQAYGHDIDIRFAIMLGYGGWEPSQWEVVYQPPYEWPVLFKPWNLEVYVAYYTDRVPRPDLIKEEVRPGRKNP